MLIRMLHLSFNIHAVKCSLNTVFINADALQNQHFYAKICVSINLVYKKKPNNVNDIQMTVK